MRVFETPVGKAGCDQLDAMTESVQSELEQMFSQTAKLNALKYGVGRTVGNTQLADATISLDAQKRECQAQATFHAGRAFELAMHIVFARGTDRIWGREFPSREKKELKNLMSRDWKKHDFEYLFNRIVEELDNRDMESAFEEVYQEALHKGIRDIYLDGELLWSFFQKEDVPFTETRMSRMIDGAEMTLDHAGPDGSLVFPSDDLSKFEQMPYRTFSEFLKKADSVYYERDVDGSRRNMRWMQYCARDHEYGRPYVVAGSNFFARLVGGILGLSQKQWTWHPDFLQRWHERRQYIIGNLVRIHLKQTYTEVMELPEMKSIEEMATLYKSPRGGKHFRDPETYNLLHKKVNLQSQATPSTDE